jgi:hypothetical protein
MISLSKRHVPAQIGLQSCAVTKSLNPKNKSGAENPRNAYLVAIFHPMSIS